METKKYIAIFDDGISIYGIGKTAQEAMDQAKTGAAGSVGGYKEYMADLKIPDTLHAQEATEALIKQVEAHGGQISWDEIDGVACTDEEKKAETCCTEVQRRVKAALTSLQDEDGAVDTIANLLHLAEAQEGDVEAVLRRAHMHWVAERHGGPDHGE